MADRMKELKFRPELTLAIPVENLRASIAWYEEMLGCKLIYKVDEIGWCEMTLPVQGVTIGLSVREKPKPAPETTPTWGVLDIEKTRAAIEAKKVKFDGPTRVIPGMVKLATFYDPDGNSWQLAESLQANS